MPSEADQTEMQTLLKLPISLYRRIEMQAKGDKRTVRPEMEVLLDEAVTARERKSSRTPQGNPGGGSE